MRCTGAGNNYNILILFVRDFCNINITQRWSNFYIIKVHNIYCILFIYLFFRIIFLFVRFFHRPTVIIINVLTLSIALFCSFYKNKLPTLWFSIMQLCNPSKTFLIRSRVMTVILKSSRFAINQNQPRVSRYMIGDIVIFLYIEKRNSITRSFAACAWCALYTLLERDSFHI